MIVSDKGEGVKRCQCCERQKAKAGRWRSLAHTRWSGGRGYLSGVRDFATEYRYEIEQEDQDSLD